MLSGSLLVSKLDAYVRVCCSWFSLVPSPGWFWKLKLYMSRFRHMNHFLQASFTRRGHDECLRWILKLADPHYWKAEYRLLLLRPQAEFVCGSWCVAVSLLENRIWQSSGSHLHSVRGGHLHVGEVCHLVVKSSSCFHFLSLRPCHC